MARGVANDPARVRLGRSWGAAWILAAGFSLWVRTGIGIQAIADASLDDGLFVRLARNIGAGQWLGTFDHTILVKGPFYSLFILASFLAGVPLKLAEQSVYLLACAYVALLVVRSERRRATGTVLFVLLALNPVFWNAELARVIREGLYVSLSLGVVGLAAGLAVPTGRPWLRGLGLGLVAGAFWLTREEGLWLAPAVLTILLIASVPSRRLVRPPWFWTTGAPLLAAAGAFAAVVGTVVLLNGRVYGAPRVVEVTSSSFEHAYGAISRIRQRNWVRYVVFPADARALAYDVSPAARELQPYLDGPSGATWGRIGCQSIPGTDCGEIQAAWFQWALRDAVAAAGHYSSAAEAARYYDRLAQEIDAACGTGALPCLPPRATLAPPFRWNYVEDALGAARQVATILLQLGGRDVEVRPSSGPQPLMDMFEEAVGPVNRAPVPLLHLDGWVGAEAAVPMLALRPHGQIAIRSDLAMLPATDLAGMFPALQLARFTLTTDCPPDGCDVMVDVGGQETVLPLTQLLKAGRIERPGLQLNVDRALLRPFNRGTVQRAEIIAAIARPIGRAYAAVMPGFAVLGVVGVLLALLRWRSGVWRSPLFALAAASLVAIASRVALLAYLDVTSIPSARLLYASPAAPFVILLAAAGTAAGLAALRGRDAQPTPRTFTYSA